MAAKPAESERLSLESGVRRGGERVSIEVPTPPDPASGCVVPESGEVSETGAGMQVLPPAERYTPHGSHWPWVVTTPVGASELVEDSHRPRG